MTWEFFSYEGDPKLACSCCGARRMDDTFMSRLDSLRRVCGFPLGISSGYRCPVHNSAVSSTGDSGPHTTGRAVDIPIVGSRAYRIITEAQTLGFTGIGVKQSGPHKYRFIHLDDLGNEVAGPRPWVWSYP